MRYRNSSLIKGGKALSTNQTIRVVRDLVKKGTIQTTRYISKEGDRLDVIAGRVYGDSSYWWLIAICSNIGWSLQIPPNTIIEYPSNLQDVLVYV